MAINPINVNRVSSNLRTDSLLASLRRSTLDVYLEQNRLSLGRRFLTPSEDPRRAARALGLHEILDQQSQIATNIRHAADTLDATDSAMAEVSDLIIDAKAVGTQNLGSLASADERLAAADVVASIREQLVAIGNRTFEGRYLFAGRLTNTKPFDNALGGVGYVGDEGDIFARVDTDELDEINLPGSVLFGALSSPAPSFVDLDPVVTGSTRLEDLSGGIGLGISKGSFEIVEDGGAGAVTIDISNADTLADVVDIINTAAADAGAGFTASLSDVGIDITPGGGALTVRDISTGTTARDLGITATDSAVAVVGLDLSVALTRTTRIDDLLAGAGVDLTDGIVIANGPNQTAVDLSQAETVQDVLNAINSAGLHVKARINESRNGIEVVNTVSGLAMSVGENGGNVATVLGIRSLHGGTLVTDLNNGQGLRTYDEGTDIRITAKDGSSFEVDLTGVATIDDVLTVINDAATTAGVNVTAALADVGNGIQLDDATGGAGNLSVTRANFSYALDDLGLNKSVQDPAAGLVGDDVNAVKVNGVLSALIDLENALRSDDSQGITIAIEDVDNYVVDFNRARGQVGARAGGMRDRLEQTESATTATQSFLSDIEDLDYTESVTKFQQAQTTLQATLLTGSQLLNTSLLNFLQQ